MTTLNIVTSTALSLSLSREDQSLLLTFSFIILSLTRVSHVSLSVNSSFPSFVSIHLLLLLHSPTTPRMHPVLPFLSLFFLCSLLGVRVHVSFCYGRECVHVAMVAIGDLEKPPHIMPKPEEHLLENFPISLPGMSNLSSFGWHSSPMLVQSSAHPSPEIPPSSCSFPSQPRQHSFLESWDVSTSLPCSAFHAIRTKRWAGLQRGHAGLTYRVMRVWASHEEYGLIQPHIDPFNPGRVLCFHHRPIKKNTLALRKKKIRSVRISGRFSKSCSRKVGKISKKNKNCWVIYMRASNARTSS